uniref:Uncharacterized protein n=1 Tax=Aegilops tauschii subsp. strangulata TaxID=200361 RepID=A0A453MY83_AEGTS
LNYALFQGNTALFSLVGRLQGNKLGTCRITKRTQTAASSSKAEEERYIHANLRETSQGK